MQPENTSDTALIIFVKNPEKGKVKTRLAATVGDDKALRIYKELLRHTREIVLNCDATRHLFYSQKIVNDDWSEAYFKKSLQVDGDLGVKMQSAFEEVLSHHSKAIIIGSDCASLTVAIVQEAIQKLEGNDVVIGPALDGGYYLLGIKKVRPELFMDIPWSTEEVLPLTIEKLNATGASYHLLPALSDIDYEEDWERYGWEVE